MNTEKRLLALILSFVLVLLPFYPSGAQAADPFKDVKGHWAIEPIKWANDNNFLAGYEDNTFRPNKTITKGEYVALLNRTTANIANSSASSVKLNFADVKKGDWFYEEVQKAVKSGYLDESSYGAKLNPNSPISRGEAATMLVEAKGLEGNIDAAMDRYSDVSKMTDPVLFSVGGLADLGIMGGYPDGSFRPLGSLTRAEVVSMFQRYFKATGETPVPRPSTPSTPNVTGDWYWSFNNSGRNFGQAYTIIPEHWNILEKANLSPADLQTLRNKSQDPDWGGSCFGFSMTTGLYHSGKFSVSGLGQNTDQISKIQALGDYKAQSAINMYMNTQNFPSAIDFFERTRYYVIQDNTRTASNAAKKAIQYIDAYKAGNAEPPMIGYFFASGGGHSVMAYDYVDNGGVLELKIYDNAPGDLTTTTVLIDRANNAVFESSRGETEQLIALEVHTASEYANAIGGPFMSPSSQGPAKNSKNYLTTGNNKAVTVTTAEGKKITITPETPGARPFFSRPGYIYPLPNGTDFTIEGPGANKVAVRMAEDLAIVEADNVNRVHVSPTDVTLDGQKGDVKVSLTNENAPASFGGNTIEVVGRDAGSLNISQEGNGYQVSGNDLSNVTIASVNGNDESAISVPSGQNSVQVVGSGNDQITIVDTPNNSQPPANFAGMWIDIDGNMIRFDQNGNNATFTTYYNGEPFETMSGTITGNTFTWTGSGYKSVFVLESENEIMLTNYDTNGDPVSLMSFYRSSGSVG